MLLCPIGVIKCYHTCPGLNSIVVTGATSVYLGKRKKKSTGIYQGTAILFDCSL